MIRGKIVKQISNDYTVKVDGKLYVCKARGKFRNLNITPLVGDIVDFNEQEGIILNIKERRNELNRPMIANVDYAIIVTSCKKPDYSSLLLDKMLTNVIMNDIKPIVVFTKYDLLTEDEKSSFNNIIDYYNKIGIPTFVNTDILKIEKEIIGSTVVLTGQTGAGKSSLLNRIDDRLDLATNEISEALGRGKHTTRHVELFDIRVKELQGNFYMADTPGFSALDVINDIDNIRFAFYEFDNDGCKFRDCKHINEIGCRVKEQVENGEIMESRYENYKKLVMECESNSFSSKK
jgi:ribosome biogenesis GTPase